MRKFPAKDRKIFEALIRFLDTKKTIAAFPDQLIQEIGQFFLGTPYVAGTLDAGETEHLVVNLREFDCVTFVETVVALAQCVKSREKSFEAFRRLLQKIRYRQGRLRGYLSRLHYFSDWIDDNQQKGVLRDVTAEIGGKPLKRAMTFMTTHRNLYPPLRSPANLRRMRSLERTISRRSLFFIPKENLRVSEYRIRDGDVIAITADTDGLDVQHVGLAVRVRNRIRLLHASSREGKVVLSPKTLYRYLIQNRTRTGILVARVTI